MLTKKDFERAAEIVRASKLGFGSSCAVEEAFIDFFRGSNPQDRFRAACSPAHKGKDGKRGGKR